MFPTEEACRSYLFARRWPNGFACPRCGGVEHYHISTRDLYECAYCHYQASLTAGTVMEGTRTPLLAWFMMIFLMSAQKTGVSVLGASHMLGISYKRAWLISHKVRQAMADRDSRYMLAGLVELDESYFGGRKKGKHGRGATGKRAVLIAVSLGGKAPLHARMSVLEGVKGEDIKAAVGSTIRPGARVATDGFVSYIPALAGYEHDKRVVLGSGKEASDKLPWVHVLAANAKGMVRGVHHGVSPRHLQAYLSEFCWRFSRRSFTGELFDRLLWACIKGRPLGYRELVAPV